MRVESVMDLVRIWEYPNSLNVWLIKNGVALLRDDELVNSISETLFIVPRNFLGRIGFFVSFNILGFFILYDK